MAASPAVRVGRGSLMGGNVVDNDPHHGPRADPSRWRGRGAGATTPRDLYGVCGWWGVGTLLGPEGTGPALSPAGGWGRLRLRAGCPRAVCAGVVVVLWRCGRCLPHRFLSGSSCSCCVWVLGVPGGGVWWWAKVSGWPRGVCELDSGCEHLDRCSLPSPVRGGGVGGLSVDFWILGFLNLRGLVSVVVP